MGHANTTNISRCFNRMASKAGSRGVTIREVVNELERTKQTVHAGEGEYSDRYMLSIAVEEVVTWLRSHAARNPLLEPAGLSRKQKAILDAWDYDPGGDKGVSNWDCGDDGEGGEYGALDSIRWVAQRKRLPVLNYVEN
jgi:hypothetical protein